MIRWTEDATPGTPYWWEGAVWPTSCNLPDAVDLLVIGAGYTGLSAAIAAAYAGASVAVVDAGTPGQGASTRNGGMAGAHPRLGWDALRKLFGREVADGVFAEAAPAFRFMQDLVTREGIDCDFQATGRIQLAWTEKQFASQKVLAGKISAKSAVKVEIVERDGLGTEVGTDNYFGGLLFHDHAALHPRKYHDGLMAALRRRGVPVVGHAAVTALRGGPGAFRAHTRKGMIRAERVVLATNGYTTRPFGWHLARVFPLPSYLIATEPLPENLLGHLAPGRRMMVETRARHSYFRLSPDGSRILFGGRAAIRPIPVAEAAKRLRKTMLEVWPELSEARLSHAWTGNTGYSFTHLPMVGERDGVHFAMGFSGSGTVMAPYLGAKAAWRALGDPRGETIYTRTSLKRSWLHPFDAPHFLKAADLWYRHVVDVTETRAGRQG